MSGTFSSLSGALSALRYNRVAMDVASGNVANAHTEGYTRRMSVAQATGAPAVQALWSRWNGSAGGVEVGGTDRMVDVLLDARSRTENGMLSFLNTRASSLVRFETTVGEPGEGGIAAALSAFKQGWHDVANNPGDEAARSQLLGRAETLVASVASQARSVATEWSDQRTRLDAVASEINEVSADLAKLNDALRSAYVGETDAGSLLDQRDQLTLRLARLAGGEVTIAEDTTVSVTVAGQTIVGHDGTSVPVVVGGSRTMAGAAANPVRVNVGGSVDASGTVTGGTDIVAASGALGGAQSLITQDLPDYLARLDGFVGALVSETNTQHRLGRDLDDNMTVDFFDPAGTTAATLTVAVTDPRGVAAAAASTWDPANPAQGRLDASNASALGNLDLGAPAYRSLVTDLGVTVASVRRVAENQSILTNQVDASREALSGVNIDEEMVNLLAAQRAYEGAARVLTTLDSVLDTLINRTGLTR